MNRGGSSAVGFAGVEAACWQPLKKSHRPCDGQPSWPSFFDADSACCRSLVKCLRCIRCILCSDRCFDRLLTRSSSPSLSSSPFTVMVILFEISGGLNGG